MKDFQLLVSLAGRIIQGCQICLNSALRPIGIGSAEANVLMFLFTSGDGVNQEDIVAAIEVSKPAISRTIASLVTKGFVTRQLNESDRRSYIIYLTDKAREKEPFIQEQYATLVEAASGGVAPDKVAGFIEVFRQVADNVDSYRKENLTV